MSKAKVPFTRAEIGLLCVLAIAQFSHIVDFMIFMPLGPQLMRMFSIGPKEFSLLVSAYTFCAGLSGICSSFFLDRFDRKKSFLFFYLGFSLSTLGCALSDNYALLLMMRCAAGAFGGVLGSMVFTIIGDSVAPEKRGTANGIIMASFSLASIFGVPFSLYLANRYSWHAPLFSLAGLGVLTLGLVFYTVPPQRQHLGQQSIKDTWKFIQSLPRQWRASRAMLLMATVVLGQFAIVPFISPSLVANAGMAEADLPYIYLVGGLLSIISSPLFGRSVDRFGAISVFLVCAPISMIPLMGITLLSPMPLPLILAMTGFLFVMMGGRMVPTMTFLTGSVAPKNRGAFMSLSTALQQLAAGAGSFLAGHIVVNGPKGELLHYPWIGLFSIVLTSVALALAFQLRQEPNQVKIT